MIAQLFLRCVARPLTWLRYRVEIEGLDRLPKLRGPALVLPNHPGHIDPVLVMSRLGGEIPLRPLVVSFMYRPPLLLPLMKFINALEVPDLVQHSHSAREQVEPLINTVVEGLDRGEKFLIYPSGRLERNGFEQIGSTRAVPDILARRPGTTVVLVRTVGVWGSMTSFAPTGREPNLGKSFVRALGILAANLIFLTPRRRIKMTVEVVDPEALPGVSREKLNPWLEAWYNRGLSTEPVYVPYHFWFGPRTFDYPQPKGGLDVPLEKITPATRQAVLDILEEKLKRPLTEEEKKPETLLEKLGLDSLDRMDLAQIIEQRFGFRSEQVATTVGELGALAQGLVEASGGEAVKVPEIWNAARANAGAAYSVAAPTILEAFARQALTHPDEAAAADDLSGVVTYARMLAGARLMAKRFAALPSEAVGLMLPASVAADTAFMALLWARKRPVLLNWTTGPVHLNHAAKVMGIRRVITSRKFIDRSGVQIEGVDYVFLEDVRKEIGKLEALATLAGIRLFPGRVLAGLPAIDPNDIAVVLFTSGSEKAPKAVPLTHRNIVTDVQAGASAMAFQRGDILLGFLPPFHSFGLSGNIVLPLAGGVRVVHHADPTDAHGLVRKIAAYKPTLLLTTPTFFSYILNAAKPADLASLRMVVTGAEKCPDALFARAKEMTPGAILTEGYGITECSPVVSVSRHDNLRPGTIGQPLEGVEVLVVDPDSMEPLPAGDRGLLLVHGATIFPGYLHYDGPSPFHERDWKRWYVTGDLARVDAEGFIHFAGRLKRFLKAGGEMISLPAIEEPLASAHPAGEKGPQVAVEGIETSSGRRIVLFTTTQIKLADANALLTQAGFRGIMRLDEVRRVDALPLLGTGKIDYKVLRAQIKEGGGGA
ncbi:MAG TPA: AMP-binding protein [Candidatus Methylacidiphilales bacterium]|jgi:long-chain-fatty-acid--[acyl-carrier-protein] ligase|nr:AMP-binding protein [Candidatus Methylacidiphilales bacterium]